MGLGMGATFVAITIAATSGVPAKKSGLASGLLNTSQQIGGALGLAILTGVATSSAANHLNKVSGAHDQLAQVTARVQGFHTAFYVATGFMITASILAMLLIKQQKGNKIDPQALMPH